VTSQPVASKTLASKNEIKAPARNGLKQPTSIGAGTSAIGSGIGGGLRRPTVVKPADKPVAATLTNQNGISGSKIQNNFSAQT